MPLTPVYALEEPPDTYSRSIFAAGPTPRDHTPAPSWRPDLITELERAGYDGVVFIPEPRNGVFHGDYQGQVDWERRHLATADVIVFWVPRDMTTMPAMTTNVEWGEWSASGRAVLGTPPGAPHTSYLRHTAAEHHVPVADTLPGTVAAALALLGDGAPRTGGERDVPLLVWRTPAFRSWYAAQRAAGNTLLRARIAWTSTPPAPGGYPFAWVMHVHVHVAAEDRVKTNEFVLARPDTVAVLAYRPGPTLEQTQVVLVREFRSTGSGPGGFVHELPGGSSHDPTTAWVDVARAELAEETGLDVDPDRLRPAGDRQVCATWSAHHAHLFTVELTAPEAAAVQAGTPCGQAGDSELTYPLLVTVADITAQHLVDWATLGMVLGALT